MPHHLEPVPSSRPDEPDEWDEADLLESDEPEPDEPDELAPLVRPAWWRWVAIAVIVAMVAAGPFAYVLSKLLS